MKNNSGQNKEIEISIIIPMFNEENQISSFIDKMKSFLDSQKIETEVILVNDGSTDQTILRLKDIIKNENRIRFISYVENKGRGYALRKGFAVSKGKYVVTIEFDLSYGTDIINKFYNLLSNDIDIVIASPYRKGGTVNNVPFIRKYLSIIGNKILKLTTHLDITTFTGMCRGYKGTLIRNLLLEEDGKEIHLEILCKSLILKSTIKEIPADLTWTRTQSSNNNIKRRFNYLKLIQTHLLYVFNESPLLLFGSIGLISLILGSSIGSYLFINFFIMHNVIGDKIILILSSVFLIITGMQIFLFCFLSYQNLTIKKELFKLMQLNYQSQKNNSNQQSL